MSNKNEIDLSEFIRTLWDNKIFIIIVCIIFGVSSVIYALSLPNKYTSSSTLIISDTSSSTDGLGGMASQYGGLASLAGVRLPTSSSKDKLVLAEETIKSRDFMKILLGYDNTLKIYLLQRIMISQVTRLFMMMKYTITKMINGYIYLR